MLFFLRVFLSLKSPEIWKIVDFTNIAYTHISECISTDTHFTLCPAYSQAWLCQHLELTPIIRDCKPQLLECTPQGVINPNSCTLLGAALSLGQKSQLQNCLIVGSQTRTKNWGSSNISKQMLATRFALCPSEYGWHTQPTTLRLRQPVSWAALLHIIQPFWLHGPFFGLPFFSSPVSWPRMPLLVGNHLSPSPSLHIAQLSLSLFTMDSADASASGLSSPSYLQ